MCTIDGLHFNSIYRTRVSAFNKTGKSHHGEILQLQTALGMIRTLHIIFYIHDIFLYIFMIYYSLQSHHSTWIP